MYPMEIVFLIHKHRQNEVMRMTEQKRLLHTPRTERSDRRSKIRKIIAQIQSLFQKREEELHETCQSSLIP
jgi:hypothetical protein